MKCAALKGVHIQPTNAIFQAPHTYAKVKSYIQMMSKDLQKKSLPPKEHKSIIITLRHVST